MVQRNEGRQHSSRNEFAGLLLNWYKKKGREFPWRRCREPYEILIAEIMLQRTKADQVVPVYLEFLKRFPDVQSLSRASTAEIAKYFSRLGLIHRAKLVKKLGRDLSKRFCGRIPNTVSDLRSLPSVGEYVADAVLCFAFDLDVSIVDSNVCRVIGRVFDLDSRGEARRDPRFKEIMDELLPAGKASKFNWAVIDLASIVCLPRKPLCPACPLNSKCRYAVTT